MNKHIQQLKHEHQVYSRKRGNKHFLTAFGMVAYFVGLPIFLIGLPIFSVPLLTIGILLLVFALYTFKSRSKVLVSDEAIEDAKSRGVLSGDYEFGEHEQGAINHTMPKYLFWETTLFKLPQIGFIMLGLMATSSMLAGTTLAVIVYHSYYVFLLVPGYFLFFLVFQTTAFIRLHVLKKNLMLAFHLDYNFRSKQGIEDKDNFKVICERIMFYDKNEKIDKQDGHIY